MILSRKIATKYYRYFETDNLDIRTFGGLDNWIMKNGYLAGISIFGNAWVMFFYLPSFLILFREE